MRQSFLPIFALLLSGCITTPDPVDKLVTRLSSSYGLWVNGFVTNLDLPATASTEQVAARVFQMTIFQQGHVTRWNTLNVRTVHIYGVLPDTYTAVMVDTDIGRKIVLLQYEGERSGWWSRVYDVEPADL